MVATLAGCGYTTRANFLPAHLLTLYIPPLVNATDQPNIELALRTELVSAFQNDGTLRLVNNESEADAILRGTVSGYTRQAVRFKDDQRVREYRLIVRMDFDFWDVAAQQAMIQERKFAGDASFFLSNDSPLEESAAREGALKNLSRRVVNRIVTTW